MHIFFAHGHRQQCGEGQGKGWVAGVKEKKRPDIFNDVQKKKKRERERNPR